MSFEDQTVLVTGGAQGIGSMIAQAFARAGAFVVMADVDPEAGREQQASLTAEGLNCAFNPCDVADEDSVRGLMEALHEQRGALDVLVNNAGVTDRTPMGERAMQTWHRVLGINLTGAYMCAKFGLPLMGRGARIINIASTRAFMSEPDTEAYAASKGGLVALTHSLAVSLAPRRIRVNAISPGWIDVSPYKKVSARQPEELRDIDHLQHPAGRVGTPNDIAQACLFLADNERAGFITGTNLMVDGGMTIKMIYEE